MVTDSGPEAKDGSGSSVLPRVGKRGAPQAFARKLYEILTTESQELIAWNADGTAFHVKDVDSFSVETLTKYYRHSKFSSFQRQLNLYSFRKIVKGPDAGGYAHRMFHRDRPDDLYHVRRSISGSGKYEPSASKTTAGAAVRRNAGRSASKASSGTEWLPGRAHKSSGASRRVGKIRSSPGSAAGAGSATPSSPACSNRADRGNVVATPSPSSAAASLAAATASLAAATADASAGERSPWTSGESSDSDVSVREAGEARDSSSDESDSDVSEAEEEGRKQRRDSGRSRANIGSVGRGAAGVPKGGEAEQVVKRTTSRQSKSSKSGERSGQDHSGSDDQAGLEQAVPPASTSASRTSTFNFLKKTFSFMERQSSSRHNRAPSVSSVDMTAAEQQQPAAGTATNSSSSVDPNNSIVDSTEDISRLLVDTSAAARAAAAGVGARPPPVTVTGRLSVDPTTAAGNKVLTSSPLTPKSSAGAAATAAAAAAAAMPPPPKREQREELGLVEQLTNMVEVFDICDLLRKVSNSNSSRLDKHGGIVKPAAGWGTGSNSSSSSQQSYHARNMSVDSSPLPQSPQATRDGQGGLGSLASMELVRDSSKEWDTLMVGSADVSDLSNTMVQSVAEFFSF